MGGWVGGEMRLRGGGRRGGRMGRQGGDIGSSSLVK
jgi:hypothetical protein